MITYHISVDSPYDELGGDEFTTLAEGFEYVEGLIDAEVEGEFTITVDAFADEQVEDEP